jgi:hypothetical protein
VTLAGLSAGIGGTASGLARIAATAGALCLDGCIARARARWWCTASAVPIATTAMAEIDTASVARA